MDDRLAQLRSMTKHELLELWLEELPDPAPKKYSPGSTPTRTVMSAKFEELTTLVLIFMNTTMKATTNTSPIDHCPQDFSQPRTRPRVARLGAPNDSQTSAIYFVIGKKIFHAAP